MPHVFIAQISLLATRECAISPIIVTVSPERVPFAVSIVKRSSILWVGCSLSPSPALIIPVFTLSAINFTAPEQLCRITTASAAIASMFFTVSIRVSPFTALDEDEFIFITSAPKRFPAISKDDLVLVDAS